MILKSENERLHSRIKELIEINDELQDELSERGGARDRKFERGTNPKVRRVSEANQITLKDTLCKQIKN